MIRTPVRPWLALAALAVSLFALTGCGGKDGTSVGGSDSTPKAPKIADTHARANDGDYDAAGATTITLADGGSTAKGAGATVKGDVVTISKAGTYVLAGSLSDGQVKVNSAGKGKVRLVLNGVDVSSASTSPLVITAADEAVVILADGTKNTLSDAAAASKDDEQPDAPTATLFSASDLTIAGAGSLTVNGKSNDGIVGKDGLVVLGGTLTVDAVDDAIAGKDYLVINDGTLTLTATGDALKSNGDTPGKLGWVRLDGGTTTVESVGHGVSAEGSVALTGGTLDVTKSDDGIKAPVVTVSGGTVSVTALGDGIKASTGGGVPGAPKVVEKGVKLTITDGTVNIDAGGDGIDARGQATITGGVVTIGKLGKNAIDVLGVSKTPNKLTLPLATPGKVELKDTNGAVVARFTAAKAGTRVVMAKGITTGQTYTVTVDGNAAGTVTAISQV
ncbi:MAG: carbohydrate-binding domain-containing protein [Aeromicrobium sp.]